MVHNTLSRRVTRYLRGLTATGVAILLALGITAALHARVANPEPRPGRGALPVSVTGFTERSSYLREQRFLGTVQAATRSDVGFEIAGVIASVEVEEGQFVAAGEILARLDRRSLLAARAVAEATVEQVRAELELARSRLARQTPW